MAEFQPWLGFCQLSKNDENKPLETIAAVWCADRASFQTILQEHFFTIGFHLIWTEEVRPAGQWIQQHPKNKDALTLARTVHDKNRVELGPLSAIGHNNISSASSDYLTILEPKITSLQDQDNVPFWDKEWITPDLKLLLFGQPETQKLHTYFIVDASLRRNITGIPDLETLDIPVRCLFKGDAGEELKESAPHLIDMTLPEGAWDDPGKTPAFHRDFFAKHWGKNTGIFIRSTASMDDIWAHCRKFTKYVDETGKGHFFRYYGENWLKTYLEGRRDDHNIMWNWFRQRANIDRYILENSGNPICLSLADNSPKPNITLGGFSIDDHDRTVFRVEKYNIEAKKLAAEISDEFKSELQDLKITNLSEILLLSLLRMSSYGFTRSNDLKTLATWEVFYGPSFEASDPEKILQKICVGNLPAKDKFRMFSKRMRDLAPLLPRRTV